MTAADMIAIYNALRGALSIAVFRAWPQIPSPLPGCAFSLQSWQRLYDGSARTDILVSFRANSPEANDGYTADARTALELLKGFDRRHRGHATLPDAYELIVRVLVQGLGRDDTARAVLKALQERYPDSPQTREAEWVLRQRGAPA